MRYILLVVLLSTSMLAGAQPYNRMIKWNVGYSRAHLNHLRLQKSVNDTGAVKLEFLSWSPTISYSHEFIFGKVISVSGTAGFQYLNLYYGAEHYGAPLMYATINPHVSLVYKRNFEFYMKLSVGASVYFHHPEVLPENTRKLAPGKVNLLTGVTLGGFNYFISDKLGLNLELSVWSVEMATFGITYRFFRGELPKIQNEGEDTQQHLEDKAP